MIEIGLAIVLIAIGLMALSLVKVSDEGEQDWKDKYLPEEENEDKDEEDL